MKIGTKIGRVAGGAALLALAACGSAAPATSSPAPATTAAAAGTSAAAASDSAQPAAARCTAADLSASLGTRTGADQHTVPLTFTNTSSTACDLYGVPGVDLHGPADPTFGAVYSLPRPGAGDEQQKHVLLQPGASASAPLTYLTANPGEPAWVPTELETTPPGDTKQLTVRWNGDSVLRQDGATHPGTYIHAVESP